ncbi:DUF1524 domain-containing protein [Geodermatophilus sp. SYSU D00691]
MLLTLAGCGSALSGTPSADSAAPSSTASTQSSTAAPEPGVEVPGGAAPRTALAVLAEVEVKGRAPRTGYSRDLFGDGWVDVDRNGCDTRNDILARDLRDEIFRPGTHDCVVLSGSLLDPYSGQVVEFQRGPETSEAVQIDHVVALSDAWQKGAQQWTVEKRTAFANDPLNLLAVDGPLNQQKSDGDAATWLPPNRTYRCEYVARQVAVKATYDLWMTAAERDAVAGILATCPDEPLPAGDNVGAVQAVPEPSVTTPASEGMPEPGSATVLYDDCAAVRAAGAAPIHRGDPGWRDEFDGDLDGVGCES